MRIRIPPLVFGDSEKSGGSLIIAPLVLIVAIPVSDYFLPSTVHLAPLLAVAPAFTAAVAGPRVTGLVCALAVVAQVVAGAERDELGTEQVLVEVCALILLSVLLVLFCYVRETKQDQLNRARLISETTQRAVLRPLPRHAGPLGIATEYRPAESDSHIGGDLFALARTVGSTRLLIGDVRGKGLDSINDMSIMIGAFRAAAHRQSPLPELVAYLEGSVHWGLAELAGAESDVGERFVTAVVADIPDDEPVIHLVSCGHPPPLLLTDGTSTTLTVRHPAPPLGLGGLARTAYVAETFAFPEGGQVLLYTDGVTEARDRTGTFYPLAERAEAAVKATRAMGPELLLARLTDDLLGYVGHRLEDDMAMIAVRRGSGPWQRAGATRDRQGSR
ncbi:PP2C family protein-serine/threonine phosphatase [Streptomyces odontomachi]|uniref:PP2C family protein-serine/threonine phosphatase n=1 Tax=Streptomyces odontomachi TaxID=2944940 RepID=UPI00210ED9D0|nr:PP2C family protein-serine/threonine phosphatase [Streptomyces sp. ODS25]